MPSPIRPTCPDCAVERGQSHLEGCDVAQCLASGRQRLQCAGQRASFHDCGEDVWTGETPGSADCRELGLWCYWEAPAPGQKYGRWIPCAADDSRSRPDLNRLHTECRWDARRAKWVRGECKHSFVWHEVVDEEGPDQLRECQRCGMIDSQGLLNIITAALWARRRG